MCRESGTSSNGKAHDVCETVCRVVGTPRYNDGIWLVWNFQVSGVYSSPQQSRLHSVGNLKFFFKNCLSAVS